MSIAIDPEFAALCPALTREELALLEASVCAEGCRDSLVVWRGLLVDGHNRLAICQRFGKEFTTQELDAGERSEVIEWMVRHQLGRRNLSEEQKSFLRGKRRLAEVNSHGTNQHTSRTGNSCHSSTDERLAEEFGVSPRTIRNDADFAEAVDEITENVGPEAKASILSGESGLARKDVIALSGRDAEEQRHGIEQPLTLRAALRQQRKSERAFKRPSAAAALANEDSSAVATNSQLVLTNIHEQAKQMAEVLAAINATKASWKSAANRENWTAHSISQIRTRFSAIEREIASVKLALKEAVQ